MTIGQPAPQLQLKDLTGREYVLKDAAERIRLLYFWSAECDWCERVDAELLEYQKLWAEQVDVLWIASNPNESREMLQATATARGISSVLVDEKQQAADSYGAQTTPHFFVVDQQGKVAYQGAWDDITFRQRVATRKYLAKAIEALLEGHQPEVAQTPPYGCVLVRFNAQPGS